MRRGKEFYADKYDDAVRLFENGARVTAIAQQLGVSYSCAYHWVWGLRKPEAGNVALFEAFVKDHGPVAAIDIKEKFPKHNDLFLIAAKRGVPIKRKILSRRYGDYAIWYFLPGQEELLDAALAELFEKVAAAKERLRSVLSRKE